ncbi:hypothetical protein GL263_17635 [Streptomyces durbertensis]|uniref:Uncharacterized protein n=1 Tax=Streptomyces durbertensis TaxID=2448886 RepID=A0ABR6EJ61_9ACTN|nr:hypothetical protein [Streptomyces durbertensis]MBB1245373.1 hypothetical protein [Streptomyces durbertensis]
MRNRMQAVATAAALTLTATLLSATAVQARQSSEQPTSSSAFKAGKDCVSLTKRNDDAARRIGEAINKLYERGLTEAGVAEAMARKHCLLRVDDGAGTGAQTGGISTLAASDEITVFRPSLWYDKNTRKWNATASWRWDKTPKNKGGDDGFGLAFNRALVHLDHGLVTTGYNGSKWYGNPEKSNDYGVGFKFKEGTKLGLTARLGTLSVVLKGTGKCQKNVQLRSQYRHTWKSTRVTGFGIGRDSVSISWTSGNNTWKLGSNPSAPKTVCK